MRLLRHARLHTLVSLALGGLFVYASVDKILHPGDFARIVYHYQLIGPSQWIGPWAANLLAVTLPWVEVVVGLALVAGFWRREAATIAGALLIVFVLAVSLALARGIDIENCGCFSVSGEGRAAGLKLILGDLAMLAGAWMLACLPASRRKLGAEASSSEGA